METLAFVDKVRVLVFLNQTLIAQATVAHFERLGDPVMAIQKTGEESTSNSPTSAPSGGSLFSNTRHASTIPWLPTGSRQKGRELRPNGHRDAFHIALETRPLRLHHVGFLYILDVGCLHNGHGYASTENIAREDRRTDCPAPG